MKPHLPLLAGIVALLGLGGCQQENSGQGMTTAVPSEQGQAGVATSGTDAPSMRDLDRGPPEHVTHLPDQIDWKEGPGSFEQGAQFAVLEGDPAASAVFTLQIKVPDGFTINPHWHPNVERVTVLKGTFHLGSGEKVDRKSAEALPTGSYTSMPPEMVHYAIAEGETIIQLTTVGPWEINYVNPEHDPRKRN